jgi:hypothetical protein
VLREKKNAWSILLHCFFSLFSLYFTHFSGLKKGAAGNFFLFELYSSFAGVFSFFGDMMEFRNAFLGTANEVMAKRDI